ncbi:MAG: DUF2892 domain-containing protein [Anaerolineales bacterium]|nr:DUF2892 domain-containing protein [Anaerolineae bacterium]MCB9129306.1 DUF2892 domain-containing protein [Anaerolineales bacterium]MCP5230491.1 DUF2892 domain-containing protein [Zoogloeaceae bacterium]
MAGFLDFMRSGVGRILRIVLGLVLIWLGLMGPLAGSTGGAIVAVIGVVPIVMGVWGPCLVQFLPFGAKA